MNNNSYVYFTLTIFSPIKIFLIGVFFITFLIVIAPVKILYFGTLYSWLYLLLSIIFILLGLTLGMKSFRLKAQKTSIKISKKLLKTFFYLASLLAFFGVILRIYDKYFIRGVNLSMEVMQNRDLLTEAGANTFSVISSFFYPLVMLIPFLYLLLRRTHLNKIRHLLITISLSLFPVIDGILLGSRSTILVFIFLNILYLMSTNYINIKLNLKNIIIFFLFLVILFILNGLMFDMRTNLISIDPIKSTQTSVYAFFIPLENDYLNLLYSIEGSLLYFFILGMINFIQYMVHGVFELLYLVDNFNIEHTFWGEQNFAVIIKFIYKILDIPFSFSDHQQLLSRTGIYNTLFGPIYYDFHFFGIIFVFILSFFIGNIFNKIVKGNIFLYPLYIYFISILFFSLVVNMIIFAQGLYTIVAFSLFYYISKILLWKKIQGVKK